MRIRNVHMRHEEKFICSSSQIALIEKRLSTFLKKDSHQDGEFYNIRSMYFDTYDDRLLEESLQGINLRHKYRIRIYNASDQVINLEKKTSENLLKQKTSCRLSRDTVEKIMSCSPWCSDLLPAQDTAREFYTLQKDSGLSPKVIVDYNRCAFINDIGNIRITIDKNISASYKIGSFFDKEILKIPVLPDSLSVLEVKFDGIFPGYLAQMLNLSNLQRVSFSKYGLCRNILENNGRIDEYYEF